MGSSNSEKFGLVNTELDVVVRAEPQAEFEEVLKAMQTVGE